MKFFLALAFVAIVVAVNAEVPEAHKEKAKQIAQECRTEFPVDDNEFAKLKAGETYDASETAKCFTNCFQEKAGITKDGVFQEENILSKFSTTVGEDKIKSIIESCRGESGSEKCETAYKLHQCFKKNGAY